MPPKKSGLGKKTAKKKEHTKRYASETRQQVQERQEKNRISRSQARANESEEEKEERLATQRFAVNKKLKSLKKSDIKFQNNLLRQAIEIHDSQNKVIQSLLTSNDQEPVAGPSKPVTGPPRPVAGPSRPVAGPSRPVAGPSRPVAGPSTSVGGPFTPVAGSSTLLARPSTPVAGPSGPFTRRNKRLMDAGIIPPPSKREQLEHIISPDPLEMSLSQPSQQPNEIIQSQLRDEEEEQDQLRHEPNVLDTDSDPDDIIFIGASHQSLAIQDSDESDESNDFGNDFEDNTSIFSLNFDEIDDVSLGEPTHQEMALIPSQLREEENIDDFQNDFEDADSDSLPDLDQLVLDPDEAEHTQMETYPSQSSDTSIPDLELNENLRDLSPYRRHLAAERERLATQRANETPEQRRARQDRDLLWHQHPRDDNPVPPVPPRRRRRGRPRNNDNDQPLTKAAIGYDPQDFHLHEHSIWNIGAMDNICRHCNAKTFKDESKGFCCKEGKVNDVPRIPAPPEELLTLFSNEDQRSKQFLGNIRQYNQAFQMTSIKTKFCIEPGFMPTVKIEGQLSHLIGSMLPSAGVEAKFLQIYFIGNPDEEVNRRSMITNGTTLPILTMIQEVMQQRNPYIQRFQYLYEHDRRINDPGAKIVISADRFTNQYHQGTLNAANPEDFAAIITDERTNAHYRDIKLQVRGGGIERVNEYHRSYDSLQYPLVLWNGQDGYDMLKREVIPNRRPRQTNTTSCQFYAYQLQEREGDFNTLLKMRTLMSQFVVDMYAKVEAERLGYHRKHQKALRAESYALVQESIQGDVPLGNIGVPVILSPSFTGGPRYMHSKTQDALTYVRVHGKPSLFITMTCSPKWIEIENQLFDGQRSNHREDIVARVFNLKRKSLIKAIVTGEIFGKVTCYMLSVEWQKRGLPHQHMLVWLEDPIHARDMDDFISAEIPDPNLDPELYALVKTWMLHGPCGNRCLVNGRCNKKFPKPFMRNTMSDRDGYPLYRRRRPGDGGQELAITRSSGVIHAYDNRHVVPFNPALLRIFQCHINVEHVASISAIKYVCKYVLKGIDRAVVQLQQPDQPNQGNEANAPRDEIKQYQMSRYLSANNALWRLFEFPVHEHYPAVTALEVHLENYQRVYYNPENLEAPPERTTTLMKFFEMAANDDFASHLYYTEMPKYYTWKRGTNGGWSRRRQGKPVPGYPEMFQEDTLGRMHTVAPSQDEAFCLRMLLNEVAGPTSFQDLKTVNGIVLDSFKAACRSRGLLDDDSHLNAALVESSIYDSARRMIRLFILILVHCSPSDPALLFENHKMEMADKIPEDFTPMHQNQLLIKIEDGLLQQGKLLRDFNLPATNREPHTDTHDWIRETSYPEDQLDAALSDIELLNPEQEYIFNQIKAALESGRGGFIFIDAPGGTGKTFLSGIILAFVRRRGQIALAVASSGIAGTLLQGGRTAHVVFKIPIEIKDDEPVCSLSKGSAMAKVIQECALILWDECTMSHRKAFEAVDRLLRDLVDDEAKKNQVMGGKLVIMTGDFRQTLPVVPRGTKADELYASIKASHLWKHVKSYHLSTNVRAELSGDPDAATFAKVLLDIGDGSISRTGIVEVPPQVHCSTLTDLLQFIYPNIEENYKRDGWLNKRAILAPKNITVDELNEKLLAKIPGEERIYKSQDFPITAHDAVKYPTEVLNGLSFSGVPPHRLVLKEGAPILVLRNLDPPLLVNGTRLVIEKLHDHILDARILVGAHAGEQVSIPRIPFIPTNFPIQMKRVQFPVRLSFAMTINKAQGQTLHKVGLYLQDPVFSHGQLYVGCSRVGSEKNLKIMCPRGRTQNVVYKEAFGELLPL